SPNGKSPDGIYVDEVTGEVLSTNAQLAAALNRINRTNTITSDVNGSLSWKIVDGLVFNTSVALRFTNNENYLYTPRYIYTNYDTVVKNNKAERSTVNNLSWNNFNTLTYSKTIKRHSFSIMAAAEFSKSTDESHGSVARLFNTDYYQWNNMNAASYFDSIKSGSSSHSMASFFGRVSYNYDSRYLFTATFRADGSSRFGSDRKFGFFPSASFAWNAKNESFLKDVRWLSSLKLRLTYGVTGNDKIGQYKSMTLLSPYKILIDDVPYTGMGTTKMIGNPNLQWETTYQYNVGLDLSFFKNRLSLTVDAYLKNTKNLLYTYSLPMSSGFETVMSNIGCINNRGIEIELTSRNIVKKNFSWTTNLALGLNRNKVVDLGGNDMVVMYTLSDAVQKDVTFLKVGQPLGVFMGYNVDVYRSWDEVYDDSSVWFEDASTLETRPGMIHYVDVDGNGYIDENDRQILGHAEPKLTGGFTNTFSFWNFDLTVFFVGAWGGNVMNANTHRLRKFHADGINQMAHLLDAYRPINTVSGDQGYAQGKYPVPIPGNNRDYTANITNYWIEDASYLRLKSLSLAYHFQQKYTKNRHKLPTATIVLTGTNLLTWTKYSGYDPEMSSSQGTANDRLGIDFSSYPAPMGFTLGVNITF
ncbi:MAG: SusC/RagA family TonB-linked outer membrane protein, partial [Candidatus Cryptobacteroides sp.]